MAEHLDKYPVCSASLRETSDNKRKQSRNLPANTCEICGKRLGNRRAYAGHMLLAHGKRVGVMAEMEAMLQQAYDMQIAMSRRLDRMEQALGYLAALHGDQSDEGVEASLQELGRWLRGERSLKAEFERSLYRKGDRQH